ncbi:MAG TPA: TlpA disulfide reductase family protein [Longimicrobiales bacterium]|nr:TlpA disulfide reductase family protein [Longimicrobiales bacterium]
MASLLKRIRSHPVAVWGERILFVAIVVWVLHRLGPQLSALTGIGPSEGSMPDFAVSTLDGEAWSSERLRGHVAVVNFWATWCAPCRVEMPTLESLWEEYAGQGVVVIGLSADVAGERTVRSTMAERGVTYPVAMADGAVRRAFGGVNALPTTFIIDREGMVRHRVVGLFAPPAMKAAVKRLVEEEPRGS